MHCIQIFLLTYLCTFNKRLRVNVNINGLSGLSNTNGPCTELHPVLKKATLRLSLSVGERILKIGRHLAKLEAKI